jgi:hypothetical protein
MLFYRRSKLLRTYHAFNLPCKVCVASEQQRACAREEIHTTRWRDVNCKDTDSHSLRGNGFTMGTGTTILISIIRCRTQFKHSLSNGNRLLKLHRKLRHSNYLAPHTHTHTPDSNSMDRLNMRLALVWRSTGFFYFLLLAGMEPSPLLMRTLTGLLYQNWMIDSDHYVAISGMYDWQGNLSIRRKRVSVPRP